MDRTQIIGIVAGICTGFSLLPQLIKIIKDKKADDLSYFMLGILLAGLTGWIWYGCLKEDYPIIITNLFSLVLNIIIIFLTIHYKKT
jgi:MtN3 and saliva related transmembrane protein